MLTIGDIWEVALGDDVTTVKVVAESESPNWWRCVDVETGVSFLASGRRFFEPGRPDNEHGERLASAPSLSGLT